MTTPTSPHRPHRPRRARLLALPALAGALALLAACGDDPATSADVTTGAGAGAAVVDPDISGIAAYADAQGLTGLSPAGLVPATGCHGLSPASAEGCSAAQLERMFGGTAQP